MIRARRSTARRPIAAALVSLLVCGCAELEVDHHDEEPVEDSRDAGVLRLGVALESLGAGCSTAGTEGVSGQLIDEMMCLTEGALVRFSHPNVTLTSSRVHPYLTPQSRDALERAAASTSIRVNSGLRTLAEQYVLWLGCPVAATPGRSNHETGRAIDVDNWSSARSALLAAGFDQPLPSSDPVHFEGPGADLRHYSVLAFQRLWNANHPGDLIDEDGITGPQTLGRLARTPAEGFAVGRVCGEPEPSLEAELVGQGAEPAADPTGQADHVACAGAEVTFWFELRNTGNTAWVDSGATGAEDWGQAVGLGVPTDEPDPLVGVSRVSVGGASNPEVRPASGDPPGGDCADAPGCSRTLFTLTGRLPSEPGTYATTWRLVDETRSWFGPELGLRFRAEACDEEPEPEPDGGAAGGDELPDAPLSPGAFEAADPAAADATMTGGCAVAPGPGPAPWPFVLALVALAQAKRARP